MLLLLLFSALASGAIFFLFRFYFRDVAHDHPLTGSLIPAAILTTLIYYQNSRLPGLAVSMVAILAFIHYRSVIKDMADVLCVFWSILSGLLIGAGLAWSTLLINLALVSVAFGVIFWRGHRITYMLLLLFERKAKAAVEAKIKPFRGQVCAQGSRGEQEYLELQVRLNRVSLEAIEKLSKIEGVERALLISEKRHLTKA